MGIINIINSKGKMNSIYELGGKSIYSFEDLLKMLLNVKKIRRILLPLNSKLMKIPALFIIFIIHDAKTIFFSKVVVVIFKLYKRTINIKFLCKFWRC